MPDPARTEARVTPSQSRAAGWGIVNVLLGVLMLPFALAMFLIERLVLAVTAASRD